MGIRSDCSTDRGWTSHQTWNHDSYRFRHGKEEGKKEGKKEGREEGKIEGREEKEDELKEETAYKNSTTRRRAEFELLNLEKVNYIKSCLFIVYGLLVLWFAYTLFKNKDMKLKQKGILIGAMLAYPYIAPLLFIYLYETVMYMVALMTGEIYKKAELQ